MVALMEQFGDDLMACTLPTRVVKHRFAVCARREPRLNVLRGGVCYSHAPGVYPRPGSESVQARCQPGARRVSARALVTIWDQ
jgi:hypothetical protein